MKQDRRLFRGASASVTANTVMRSATEPWLMNRFDPVRTYSSPSRTAVVRIAAASEPASASVRANAMSHSPDASRGTQRACCSSVPASSSGSDPSSWTARISPDVAHARLICSIARQIVRRSTPSPPWASGNGRPRMSWEASSAWTSRGNSPVRSISAARGAIRSSARTRTASRSISWSSVRR